MLERLSRIQFTRQQWRLIALAGMFLVGLLLRLYRLPTVPLGGHGDVAWIGLEALDWLHGVSPPYYVWHLYAPEPVIVYLAALSIALFGPTFFAVRLVTSLVSALVVPVGFAAVWWLDRDQPPGASTRRTAWLFALAYAVSFYPIILSKTGQRAQTFPLFVAALIALYALGWAREHWWPFIGAALVMALANYAYIPARLMPIMVLLWTIHGAITDWARFKRVWVWIVAMYVISLILVAPQLATYIQTPEAFFARANQEAGQFVLQTTSGFDLLRVIALKIGGEFAIFFAPWTGAYSEMNHPLLEIPLAVGAVIGIVAAFWHGRDKGYWWPLIAIPLMFTTDVVSGTQFQPHGLRMIGILPPVFILAARGLSLVWGAVDRYLRIPRLHREDQSALMGAILVVLIVSFGLVGLWRYHYRFVPSQQADPATTNRLEAADVFLAQMILAHADDPRPILITLDDFTRPNVTYLLSKEYRVRRSAVLADGSLDLPSWDDGVLVAMPAEPFRPRHDGIIPEHDWRTWVMLVDGEMLLLPPMHSEAQSMGTVLDPDVDLVSDWLGRPVAGMMAITLPADSFNATFTPVGTSFADEIELAGYSADSDTFLNDNPLWLTLYWRGLEGAAEDYETFVQVIDANGDPIAQEHRWTFDGMYRTRLWRSDELTPMRVRLEIPPGLAPGRYTLIAGLYRVLQNEPLGVVDAAGNVVASYASMPDFRAALPIAEVTRPQPEQPIRFGDVIELAGFALPPDVDGDALALLVDWRAIERPSADHTFFLHVVDEDGEIVAQVDSQPLGGAYPTGIWAAGEVVPDKITVPLPDDLAAGEYTIYVGWYTLPSSERLVATLGGEALADDRIPLSTFTVP